MTKTNKILFTISVIIIAAVLILGQIPGLNKKLGLSGEEKILVNVKIDGFPDSFNIKIKSGTTVLDILKFINEREKNFNLQTKDFKDLGILVEKIGADKNGDNNKYWQYYVNGELPMVGADKYVVKNNDKIEWVFAEIKF